MELVRLVLHVLLVESLRALPAVSAASRLLTSVDDSPMVSADDFAGQRILQKDWCTPRETRYSVQCLYFTTPPQGESEAKKDQLQAPGTVGMIQTTMKTRR